MAVPCGPSNPTPRPSKLGEERRRRLRAHRRLLDLGALGVLRRFGWRAASAGLFFGLLGSVLFVIRNRRERAWRMGQSAPTCRAPRPSRAVALADVTGRSDEMQQEADGERHDAQCERQRSSTRIDESQASPSNNGRILPPPNFLLLASHFALPLGVTSPRNPWRCGSWLGELWSAVRLRRFSSSASARSIARRRRPARSSWPAIRTTTRARSRSAISATSGRPTKTARASCV